MQWRGAKALGSALIYRNPNMPMTLGAAGSSDAEYCAGAIGSCAKKCLSGLLSESFDLRSIDALGLPAGLNLLSPDIFS